MAGLNEILNEINQVNFETPFDTVRRKYINEFADKTGRNVICYYSAFLSKNDNPDISINDKDINGFMTTMHGLDKTKGLDLILHSPGGDVAATEALGNYLISFFGKDIRVFVPQLSMSGGTMLACIGKEIYMGKHSSIGPIDPQFGGIPAYGIIQEYEEAKEEVTKNPQSIEFYRTILSKYPPTLVGQCYRATELSTDVLTGWLKAGGMFTNAKNKDESIKNIVSQLNNNTDTKMHARHISAEKAKKIGLNVISLEKDDQIQDLVLSIHHSYMATLENTNAVKIIENQNRVASIVSMLN